MNKVILKGNVGQDPRITTFNDGGMVATFTLATTERGFTRKDGTKFDDETTWHNVTVRREGLASVVRDYVKKGTPVLVEGKYVSRKYTDKDGNERTIYEVRVDHLELCGGVKPAEKSSESYDDLPPEFQL